MPRCLLHSFRWVSVSEVSSNSDFVFSGKWGILNPRDRCTGDMCHSMLGYIASMMILQSYVGFMYKGSYVAISMVV